MIANIPKTVKELNDFLSQENMEGQITKFILEAHGPDELHKFGIESDPATSLVLKIEVMVQPNENS